jgi:hypothetical protein
MLRNFCVSARRHVANHVASSSREQRRMSINKGELTRDMSDMPRDIFTLKLLRSLRYPGENA